MASVKLFAILILGVGVAMGSSLRYEASDTYVLDSEPVETETQVDDFGQLVSEFLALSEDDYRLVVGEIMRAVQLTRFRHLCYGDTCKICLGKLPIIGSVCLELEYVKSPAGLHLVITKNGHEILCITFHDELPKICLFHHICAQVVGINIANGKICASLAFNGNTIIRNHCIAI